MENIKLVYKKYRIMPNLAAHMFRVTAVAKIILEHLHEPLSETETAHVVSACLLHDMGNIVKFDLAYFPEFLEPEGLAYWQSVQNDFWEKYGREQHEVHKKIAEEMGVHPRTIELIEAIGVGNACETNASLDISRKICAYSDMRVGPHGIISMPERMKEFSVRYKARLKESDAEKFKKSDVCLFEIEKELFSKADISPEFITDTSAGPIISALSAYTPL